MSIIDVGSIENSKLKPRGRTPIEPSMDSVDGNKSREIPRLRKAEKTLL
eukprot:CAMPEP_0184518310 /NCGR_PEP_ID=MMETSP0198_2-20121128/6019_1 /TAXON_ID=1112570 /ORGANISM="Thraustochytrium sp., Strain LLF1b" /LENGTH=48 /DNA_ID= /DNA_START= /DNA_END= /DNA_ORIENTATION=